MRADLAAETGVLENGCRVDLRVSGASVGFGGILFWFGALVHHFP
jgi:hypothetical protein